MVQSIEPSEHIRRLNRLYHEFRTKDHMTGDTFLGVCTGMCVQVATRVCACVYIPEIKSLWLSILVFEAGSLTEPGPHHFS